MFMAEDSKIMIGKRLKKLLEDNGFDTARDSLIEEFGFNRSTLQKYLNDVRRPTLEDIVRIANYFNVSVDYLVSNSMFALDTWDHEYLEEFFQYTSHEIEDHFRNRYNVNLPNGKRYSNLLFGLIESKYQKEFQSSLEDLSEKEKEERIEHFQLISSIVLSTIEIAMKSNNSKEELEVIQRKVSESVRGEYSFADESNLKQLEESTKSNEEKIKLLKTYIGINMTNGQKALKLLEDLTTKN